MSYDCCSCQCKIRPAGTFEFDFTTTKMPSSDSKPLAMSLLQRVMSNLIVALRPSVNMHIKEILQMLRRYKYSSLQVTSWINGLTHDTTPMVTTTFHWQVMMLAKLVKIKRYRIEVAVCLFNCVTDIENFAMKLWECVHASYLEIFRIVTCISFVFQAFHGC